MLMYWAENKYFMLMYWAEVTVLITQENKWDLEVVSYDAIIYSEVKVNKYTGTYKYYKYTHTYKLEKWSHGMELFSDNIFN